jgi:peptidoglycan lytic transglycosylase G
VRFLLRLATLAILACAAWAAWAVYWPVTPPGEVSVVLRPGWSSRRIAAELRRSGVISSDTGFLLVHYADLRPLQAGEYRFDQPANARQVYQRIAQGDVFFHTVVVPEGFTLFDIAGAIEAAGLGSRQEFLQQAQADTKLVLDLDPEARSLEGYLFPDTYRFTRAQSMHDMIAAMVHRFRQEAKAIGLDHDVHRIVTMASIVEKETAAGGERALVAGVYYNRLARHIALDADPSVIYAALLAGRYTGVIHQSDLQSDSPYNTYRFAGLPPGPIANAGRAALEAALRPAATDFLYFVSDAQGHHRFARTLDEHNRNVTLYRRAAGANP